MEENDSAGEGSIGIVGSIKIDLVDSDGNSSSYTQTLILHKPVAVAPEQSTEEAEPAEAAAEEEEVEAEEEEVQDAAPEEESAVEQQEATSSKPEDAQKKKREE